MYQGSANSVSRVTRAEVREKNLLGFASFTAFVGSPGWQNIKYTDENFEQHKIGKGCKYVED